jgi:endonuclease YncB( thermonuclease family)
MRLTALLIAVTALLASCSGAPTPGRADLLTVIDGDTVLMRVDGNEESVRLVGLNAPEAGECHESAATLALESLLAGGGLRVAPAGTDDRDRFGRLLRYLYAGETLVNLAMVRQGHGLSMTGDHPRAAEFDAAADRAWGAGLGMWDPQACGAASSDAPVITRVEADPPGADGDTPNEEFVVIGNPGATAVDLSEWTLRDESSSNRFRFPSGTLLPAGGGITIHSGCGDDTVTDLYWCAGPVWSNGGDTAILQADGGAVVARRAYRAP